MKLSIIVPTHGESSQIEAFLEDLMCRIASFSQCVEVLLVNSSADNTVEKAQKHVGVKAYQWHKGRAVQMNYGAEQSTGDYLLFLHSDSRLPKDLAAWWQDVTHLRPDWGFFTIMLSGQQRILRIIEWAINRRSTWTSVATGDQALFLSRACWAEQGGYAPIALMEDVELSKRLRQFAQAFVWTTPVETSSRRWEQHGVLKVILVMWGLRLGYWLGCPPSLLSRFYR